MSPLRWLDLSLPTPAENLACDEGLLEECEEGGLGATLRFWESTTPFVVVGYGNRIAAEVNVAECAARGVGIFRRSSGGGTVAQGPGCLNYNLVLPVTEEVETISRTNDFVMGRHREIFAKLLGREDVRVRGFTDLAVGSLKFSGNAQRRKRKAVMFHGCFLLGFEIALIEALLKFPSREPEYRGGRTHAEFLTNLEMPVQLVKDALRAAWGAEEELAEWPRARVEKLARERFSKAEWNERF